MRIYSFSLKTQSFSLQIKFDRHFEQRTRNFFVIDYSSDERMWLPSDKKLFDQEIFKRDSSIPLLYFSVR